MTSAPAISCCSDFACALPICTNLQSRHHTTQPMGRLLNLPGQGGPAHVKVQRTIYPPHLELVHGSRQMHMKTYRYLRCECDIQLGLFLLPSDTTGIEGAAPACTACRCSQDAGHVALGGSGADSHQRQIASERMQNSLIIHLCAARPVRRSTLCCCQCCRCAGSRLHWCTARQQVRDGLVAK